MAQLSQIKLLALEITNEIHIISMPYIKSRLVREFLERWGKPRIDKIISFEMSDDEIKKVMWNCKQKLDRYFKKMDTAEQLFNPKLNSPGMIKNLSKLPDFRELEDLL